MASFELSSDAFGDGDDIPRRHSCEGDDISPPLRSSAPPDGTRSLALVVDDPDAASGTFTHWLAWGLEPAAEALAEGAPAPAEGRSDLGVDGYRGPCPPPGHGRHLYRFRLHALSGDPQVAPGAGRDELERAIDGLVLSVAELLGGHRR